MSKPPKGKTANLPFPDASEHDTNSTQQALEMIEGKEIRTPDDIRRSATSRQTATSQARPTASVSDANVKVTRGFNPKPKGNDGGTARQQSV